MRGSGARPIGTADRGSETGAEFREGIEMALTVRILDETRDAWTLTGEYECGHPAEADFICYGFGMDANAAGVQARYDVPKACYHCHSYRGRETGSGSCDAICQRRERHPVILAALS
jgi:hypothetical protein